jgi:hypothetical protein
MSPQDVQDWAQTIAIVAYLALDFAIKLRRAWRDEYPSDGVGKRNIVTTLPIDRRRKDH